uniref:WD_REPEATS_REGION domain-containing protein n=2 Tax=Macrostomum lignano TaxID=282301 RepID=A0A1I8IUW2_9PLAT
MASRQEPQAVRLWHLGDGRVMQNFPPPTIRHYLAAVHSADFSPGGGFLCLGQHTGRAAMFRLSHYSGY